jgi:hypothetical protein
MSIAKSNNQIATNVYYKNNQSSLVSTHKKRHTTQQEEVPVTMGEVHKQVITQNKHTLDTETLI